MSQLDFHQEQLIIYTGYASEKDGRMLTFGLSFLPRARTHPKKQFKTQRDNKNSSCL